MIYSNFDEISDLFDTLFVDAYGVFWGGSSLIPGSLEALERQVARGKNVCILSNTSVTGTALIDNYTKKGLTKGLHYTHAVSSGDVFLHTLKNNLLPIAGCKVYVLGQSKIDITRGTKYKLVSNPTEADFVFFGTPQLSSEQIKNFPNLTNTFFQTTYASDKYDCKTVTPFLSELNYLARLGLPAVSTNPDLIVMERHNGYSETNWVIRQGALAETYRQMGMQVVEFGKPYHNIYDYAFSLLNIKPSPRIAMIGDTFRTDIRGGIDNGITPVWCLETGVAKYEQDRGISLTEQAGGSLAGIYLIKHL